MADNLTTFMCRLSWNLGAPTSCNPQALGSGIALPYLTHTYILTYICICRPGLYAGLLALAKGLQLRRKGWKTFASTYSVCMQQSWTNLFELLKLYTKKFDSYILEMDDSNGVVRTAHLIFYRGINSEELANLCRLKALKLAKKCWRKLKENTSLELG